MDRLGELYAASFGIPVKLFPAEWKAYGKSAGMYRNHEMALYADALLAIWDGKSKGTLNMIEQMKKLNKPVYIFIVPEGE